MQLHDSPLCEALPRHGLYLRTERHGLKLKGNYLHPAITKKNKIYAQHICRADSQSIVLDVAMYMRTCVLGMFGNDAYALILRTVITRSATHSIM